MSSRVCLNQANPPKKIPWKKLALYTLVLGRRGKMHCQTFSDNTFRTRKGCTERKVPRKSTAQSLERIIDKNICGIACSSEKGEIILS